MTASRLVAWLQRIQADQARLGGRGVTRQGVDHGRGRRDDGGTVKPGPRGGIGGGFFESVIMETAPFGIEVTLVEPGVARTRFGRSLDVAPALDAYADTPVGQARPYIEAPEGITANGPGDPDEIADAVIASVEVSPAPRRLTLGSDAYQSVHAALTGRIEELEAASELGYSTDLADAG